MSKPFAFDDKRLCPNCPCLLPGLEPVGYDGQGSPIYQHQVGENDD